MVRKLKHHESKLLRKVDFLTWKSDNQHRDHDVLRRYHISNPQTYHKYNTLCGSIRQLAHRLSLLPPTDPFRIKHETLLLEKLHAMGLLSQKSKMSEIENKLTVAAICRRRLPVVMTRLRMAESVKAATKLVEQGHVRVGPEVITDPAYAVTRRLEDFVTWTDGSKIRKNIMVYKGEVDDFDLLA